MTLVAPSLLAADFMNMGGSIKTAENGGVDLLHIDVMDGNFVPNITFGIDMVAQMKQVANVPLDVHLMIAKPEDYIEAFAKAGADYISVHIEATPHIRRIIQQIKALGIKAGVVLNPGTPAQSLIGVLDEVDFVLQMSVNPGFGGQSFIPSVLKNIAFLDNYRKENGLNYLIEVDGGINGTTAQVCKKAGVDILVAGSYFFNSADKAQTVQLLKS